MHRVLTLLCGISCFLLLHLPYDGLRDGLDDSLGGSLSPIVVPELPDKPLGPRTPPLIWS